MGSRSPIFVLGSLVDGNIVECSSVVITDSSPVVAAGSSLVAATDSSPDPSSKGSELFSFPTV